ATTGNVFILTASYTIPRTGLSITWLSRFVTDLNYCSYSPYRKWILQSLISNAFLTALTHHIYKGVTLHASYARCKCMGVLYCKLAAFTPNTKDV
ncbi:hypothetical protein, partial [Helicobacter pylori]|uniref:hypothetical protein n=1 Tax=Helicobacter pylori TaxID=210 RepID=UPI0005343B34